jgi:DNA-binding NarL/FixJ family response regulator
LSGKLILNRRFIGANSTLRPMPDSVQIRVIVGEDEPLMREGIVRALERAQFDVVGAVADADELLRLVEAVRPDVVVTDIQMPPNSTDDGIEAARRIRSLFPYVAVLVLSQYLEAQYALALVSDGAAGVGYLLKDRVADLNAFTDAVHRVANGGSALDPEVVSRMVLRPRLKSDLDDLTPREREVLGLMAEGLSNHGIADRLGVSIAAVERHVTNVFLKLQLSPTTEDHRRVLAVLTYLDSRSTSPDSGSPRPATRQREK